MLSQRTETELLRPHKLHDASILEPSSCLPNLGGVYAWYFAKAPPRVPTNRCKRVKGHVLLYVGIVPQERRKATAKPSTRTLRDRLRNHFHGDAYGSTLRLTLGCLLSGTLRIRLHRVGERRYTFGKSGEQALSRWMARNAKVVWSVTDKPWEAEKTLLACLSLPLNIQHNEHSFVPCLRAIRRQARERARLADTASVQSHTAS